MLYSLMPWLSRLWGPFRLFGSHLFLITAGAMSAGVLVWFCLPRLWRHLPRDRGRAFAPGAQTAVGKPTGGGLWLCVLLMPVLLLVVPFDWTLVGLMGCLILSMLLGYADDRSEQPWGQLRKGLTDLAVAALAAWLIAGGRPVSIWMPLVAGAVEVSPWVFIPGATLLLWITLNATNCSDGVDGLAGSLTLMSLFSLGALLYGVVGHLEIARFLLVPHNPDGARWAVFVFTVSGGVAGYLWHNAEPSRILMGDAGSRFLGLLVGLAVLAAGNPLLIVVVAPVVLANGGTGLFKVMLLRGFRRLGFDTCPPGRGLSNGVRQHPVVRALHCVRFPLHDHCRKNLGWTNAQVLMRFVLIQMFLTPLLFVLLIKIR